MPVIESAVARYLAPTTLTQALECLRESDDVTILAGGTDLMPQSKAGRVRLRGTLLNIRRIGELSGIALDGDAIRIGALATITQIGNDPLVRQHLPVLVEACDHFASDQIRNTGTLGGNISNASPAGDTLVPLLVLDAEVELASAGDAGTVLRRVPIADYFTGPGRTRRAAGELLAGVRIPLPPAGHYARFFKFGTRPALDISAISIGLAAACAPAARWRTCASPSARSRRHRCAHTAPSRRWKASGSTPRPSRTRRRWRATRSSRSTTCAPAPGTARN